MACVSAGMEMDNGPIQTGDLNVELNRPQRVNLATAPGSCDGAYEAHGAFRAWPAHAHLRDRNPARESSSSDTSRPHGWRKWRRVNEFGTRGFPCGRVCGASRAACHVVCLRNARSRSPGRYAQAGLHAKPRRFGARVTSMGTSWRELRARGARWLAWRTPRKQALIAMRRATTRPQVSSDGRDERASRRPPPWRCKKKKK